jgi:hypothetical protein
MVFLLLLSKIFAQICPTRRLRGERFSDADSVIMYVEGWTNRQNSSVSSLYIVLLKKCKDGLNDEMTRIG